MKQESARAGDASQRLLSFKAWSSLEVDTPTYLRPREIFIDLFKNFIIYGEVFDGERIIVT